MIRLSLDAAGLSRSRFAISRLAELTNGLEVLAHPERAPYARRWVNRVRRSLDRSALRALLALVEHDSWYVPDFLVPHPTQYEATLDQELDAVGATPVGRVKEQLELAFQIGPPPALALTTARCEGDPRSPLPTEVADVLDRGGEAALLARVVEEMRLGWTIVLADSWDLVHRVLDGDVRQHATSASRVGLASILRDVNPGLEWDGQEVLLEHPSNGAVEDAAALVLTPSVFLPRLALWLSTPAEPVIGYPAYGRGQVWSAPTPLASTADLLGSRRAALLADLDIPRSTSDLALRHSLSVATISYHLGHLHQAGMLARRRDGRVVLYERTDRATGLLLAMDGADAPRPLSREPGSR